LDRRVELATEMTTCWAVVEYVHPTDWQFQRLAPGRDALHRDLTPSSFETAIQRRFRIMECRDIPTRRICVLEKERI
jgi:hypothetical protein